MVIIVNLHVHSSGSSLDGACSIPKLVKRAVELNMTALGISDHGNMVKVPEFQKECIKNNIKPIIGCEFYMGEEDTQDVFHILLIAKNNIGLKNLYKLNTLAYTKNFYKKPRIKMDWLQQYSEGLICTTACIGSEFGKLFTSSGNVEEIKHIVLTFKALFGNDFYLEIQPNGVPKQREYNELLIRLAHECNIYLVATTDVHYVHKEDYESHDTLLCMQTGKKKQDTDRWKFTCNDFYLKSAEEMRDQLYQMGHNPYDVSDAVSNTHVIADKCSALVEFGQDLMPHLPGVVDEALTLAQHCNLGFVKRQSEGAFDNIGQKELVNRVRYELQIIKDKNLSGYFLIVEDYINEAKRRNIFVGDGRGSCAGSEVAFILGITNVEPIKYGLLFERFMNPTRVTTADIDSDFCYERRDEMVDYMKEKYGSDNIAQIIAEGSLTCGAVVRKVLSAYDYEQKVINNICSKIPKSLHMTLQKALDVSPEFTWAMNGKTQELKDMFVLEGLMSHASKHAAGLAVASEPISNYVPCMSTAEDRTALITQWHKKTLEELGLWKFDFLALKTLTIIRHTLENIKTNRGIDVDLSKIDYENPVIYELLNSGHLSAVFQFSEPSGKQAIFNAKPTCFEDVIACESICRPGVRDAELYIANKKFYRESGTYPLPTYWEHVKDILGSTYGAIVYQEQTMLIVNKLAEWSLGKGDSMRKSKDLEELREEFVRDCLTVGLINEQQSNEVFDRFSMEYSFCKGHAVAYAMCSAKTAYLSALYPVEFMAAVMSMDIVGGDGSSIPSYVQECNIREVKILPPNINKSGINFICDGDSILYPLTGIANIGEKAVASIIEHRPFNTSLPLSDLLDRVPKKNVNKRCVINLIKSGAFDLIPNVNRSLLINNYLERIKEQPNQMTWCPELQMQYELDTLGFTLSRHPLDGHVCKNFNLLEDGECSTIGIVREVKVIRDKNDKEMAFVKIENKSANIELIVFSYIYATAKTILLNNMRVAVSGRKEGSKIIVSKVEVL